MLYVHCLSINKNLMHDIPLDLKFFRFLGMLVIDLYTDELIEELESDQTEVTLIKKFGRGEYEVVLNSEIKDGEYQIRFFAESKIRVRKNPLLA